MRRNLVFVGGLALALALALVARAMRAPPHLPVLGVVPAFHLQDERGAPFGNDALFGHVSVIDFVFTRCTSSCPRLTARMAELQARLKKDGSAAKLVSISVDPENDTPAVLAAYAAKAGADPARWTFVTGPVDAVTRAVVLGFKMSAVKVYMDAGDYDVTHGNWFVLADGEGGIRGYYPTEEKADFEKLVADTERLEKEKR
ncbi:MAG TPA: SCO family protein [Polyangiaceae bacterium]|nr:SCO family protein [Polyangiaceae bacterium]